MSDACYYLKFGLIVTGETERGHLPRLFRSVMNTGICHFEVIKFIPQLRPITSPAREIEMPGTGKRIPRKDEQIGLEARGWLAEACTFVILIDDLEPDWRDQAQQVYERYRHALDTILLPNQQRRAAVHFLVNMLEAYFFADANAVNTVLGLNPPLEDHNGDVEEIRNPKSLIKHQFQGYNEIEHGGAILERLDVEHILSNPATCAWLRTLFAWCVRALAAYPDSDSLPIPDYKLAEGVFSPITRGQIDALP